MERLQLFRHGYLLSDRATPHPLPRASRWNVLLQRRDRSSLSSGATLQSAPEHAHLPRGLRLGDGHDECNRLCPHLGRIRQRSPATSSPRMGQGQSRPARPRLPGLWASSRPLRTHRTDRATRRVGGPMRVSYVALLLGLASCGKTSTSSSAPIVADPAKVSDPPAVLVLDLPAGIEATIDGDAAHGHVDVTPDVSHVLVLASPCDRHETTVVLTAGETVVADAGPLLGELVVLVTDERG